MSSQQSTKDNDQTSDDFMIFYINKGRLRDVTDADLKEFGKDKRFFDHVTMNKELGEVFLHHSETMKEFYSCHDDTSDTPFTLPLDCDRVNASDFANIKFFLECALDYFQTTKNHLALKSIATKDLARAIGHPKLAKWISDMFDRDMEKCNNVNENSMFVLETIQLFTIASYFQMEVLQQLCQMPFVMKTMVNRSVFKIMKDMGFDELPLFTKDVGEYLFQHYPHLKNLFNNDVAMVEFLPEIFGTKTRPVEQHHSVDESDENEAEAETDSD